MDRELLVGGVLLGCSEGHDGEAGRWELLEAPGGDLVLDVVGSSAVTHEGLRVGRQDYEHRADHGATVAAVLAERVRNELHVGVLEVAALEGGGEGDSLHMGRLDSEGWGAFRQSPYLPPGALMQERLEIDDHSGADHDHVAAKALPHDRSSGLGSGMGAVEEPVAVASRDPVVEPGDESAEQGADGVCPLRRLEVQVRTCCAVADLVESRS
jgi:hypothetical protein